MKYGEDLICPKCGQKLPPEGVGYIQKLLDIELGRELEACRLIESKLPNMTQLDPTYLLMSRTAANERAPHDKNIDIIMSWQKWLDNIAALAATKK